MKRSRDAVIVSVVGIAAMTAGCGNSDSKPSLVITGDNAPVIADMVLVERGHIGSASAGPIGLAGPMTVMCLAGTLTRGGTEAASTLTLDHCREADDLLIVGTDVDDLVVDGTIRYSPVGGSVNSLGVSVTLDLTMGDVNIAESGSYDLVPGTALTDGSLQFTITAGGIVRDMVTLSDVQLHETNDVLGFGLYLQAWTQSYEVDSSRLSGHFTVATMSPLKHLSDGSHLPFTGQLEITGANNTRLVITIAGDELSVPPAGTDQIKLEVDPGTGTLGAPIWMSWAAVLATAAM